MSGQESAGTTRTAGEILRLVDAYIRARDADYEDFELWKEPHFESSQAAYQAIVAAVEGLSRVVEAAVAWNEAWSAPSRSQRAKEKARILGFAESRDRLRAAVWDYLEGSPPPATASQDETPLVDFALTQGRRRAAMEDEEAADG